VTALEKPSIDFPSVLDRAYKDYKRHRKVGDIMSRDVFTTTAETPMIQAAKIMAAQHIRRLPLSKKKQLTGIITARDLVEAYAA
jgi:CBS domain-containing protein